MIWIQPPRLSNASRVTLSGDRTYYVRAGGTRTGDLVTETSATTNVDVDAFNSINAAISALIKLDCNGYIPEIFVGAGTFPEVLISRNLLGADKIKITRAGSSSTNIGRITSEVLQKYEFTALQVLYSSTNPFDQAIYNNGGNLFFNGDCIINYTNSSAATTKGSCLYDNSAAIFRAESGLTFKGSCFNVVECQNTAVFNGQNSVINFVDLTCDNFQFLASGLGLVELGGATINGSPGGSAYLNFGGGQIRLPNYSYN